MIVILEDELRSKLYSSGIANASNNPKQSACHVRAADSSEVSVVEDIKSLAAKLEQYVFTEAKVFRHRKIDPESWWTINNAPPSVSYGIWYPALGRRVSFETSRVEPLLLRPWRTLVRVT